MKIKSENNQLKSQVSTLTEEISGVKDLSRPYSAKATSRSLEFLSKLKFPVLQSCLTNYPSPIHTKA